VGSRKSTYVEASRPASRVHHADPRDQQGLGFTDGECQYRRREEKIDSCFNKGGIPPTSRAPFTRAKGGEGGFLRGGVRQLKLGVLLRQGGTEEGDGREGEDGERTPARGVGRENSG